MESTKDPHHILGVPRGLGLPALRAAFRREALLRHPDKGGTAASFREALLAFRTLSALYKSTARAARLVGKARHRRAQHTSTVCRVRVRRQAGTDERRCQPPNSQAPLAVGIGVPQRKLSPGGKSSKAIFLRALRTLQSILALMPTAVRRSAIDQLPPELKRQLTFFVERNPRPSKIQLPWRFCRQGWLRGGKLGIVFDRAAAYAEQTLMKASAVQLRASARDRKRMDRQSQVAARKKSFDMLQKSIALRKMLRAEREMTMKQILQKEAKSHSG